MNVLDIGIAILGLAVTLRGYYLGLMRGIPALVSLVLAVWIGVRFYAPAARSFKEALGPLPHLELIGFVVLFLASLVIFKLISAGLSRLLTNSPLSGLDRLLGLVLGAAKAAILIILAVGFLAYLLGPTNPLIAKSHLAPYALKAVQEGVDRLSKKLESEEVSEKKKMIEQKLRSLKESVE